MLQNILHFGYLHLSWIYMKKSETAMDMEKAKKIIIIIIIIIIITVKPVCNDHLYNKIYYLWFIQ